MRPPAIMPPLMSEDDDPKSGGAASSAAESLDDSGACSPGFYAIVAGDNDWKFRLRRDRGFVAIVLRRLARWRDDIESAAARIRQLVRHGVLRAGAAS